MLGEVKKLRVKKHGFETCNILAVVIGGGMKINRRQNERERKSEMHERQQLEREIVREREWKVVQCKQK